LIPETGNRKDLKRAWFDSLSMPVAGELYIYHSPMKHYYHVLEVVDNPKGFVRVQSYTSFDQFGCYRHVGSTFRFTLRQWRQNIRHRQMTYHAPELPPVLGVVI
jgi:hypothetical protein